MAKLKDIPKFDRPREKFLEKGPDALTDGELLAILLGSGIKGTNVKVLAQKILKKFGDNFLNASVDDLMQVSGIGQAKALQISSALALTKRIFDKQNSLDNLILSAQDAISLIPDLKDKKQEHLICLYLNARNALIKKETISIGTLDKSIIHPREIFAPGLEMHAAGVILAHNHPSGDANPSEQDRQVAKRIIEAGQLMGVNVIDFLIIAKNGAHSILGEIKNTKLTNTEYVAEGSQASLFDLLIDANQAYFYEKSLSQNLPETEDKKSIFLKSNFSEKNKCKRYLGSPLRYAGGKSLAVGHIIQLIPENLKKVVSPFLGGASVEIAIAKELGIEVISYDIFDILINFWQVQLQMPEKLFKELSKLKPTKEEYTRVKEILKKHWKKEIKLDKLKLAAYYYFNHNLSYGPGFLGWPSSVYLNAKRYKTMLEKLKKFKAEKLKALQGDFKETIAKHKEDFMYLDPPYFLEGDSKMFRGIYPQRNFPVHHNGFDHKRLYELLKEHKGGFILSYNDCKQIREWYKDYEIYKPSWQYTMGQGETRIGLNRIKNGSNHVKKSHELLIFKPANL